MKQRITGVDAGSIAEELGILPGWELVSIDGEEINDIIDYEQLTAREQLLLVAQAPDGETLEAEIEKDLYEPLGLDFQHGGLMSPIRACKNHCLFCFIDQMPKGVRKSLHVKDDDWRLSLIMGNYVTLTNVDDAEFARILKRKVSPLYVSVHATDPVVRTRMMNNPTAGCILERLRALKNAGIRFHLQIVLCPGINDGAVLQKSMEELYALAPAAQTLAVVPVGLTKFREKLYPLRCLAPQEARAAIAQIEVMERRALSETSQPFVYASDEMYMLAGLPLPPASLYGEYEQIENGVGLLRRFEAGYSRALAAQKPLKIPAAVDVVCGVSAAEWERGLLQQLRPYRIEATLHPVKNDYFGHTITVSGLITAGDIAAQLKGRTQGNLLLTNRNMMRENDTVFLDGRDLAWLAEELGMQILPLDAGDGEEWVNGLFGALQEKQNLQD